jgi:hypothetical protein
VQIYLGVQMDMKHFLVATLGGVALVGGAFGQQAGANATRLESVGRQGQDQAVSQRAEKARSQSGTGAEEGTAPELFPGESDDLGPQQLLLKKPRAKMFELSSDTQALFTSNALLSERGHRGVGVFVQSAGLTFAPRPLELGDVKLAFRSGYRQQFWLYEPTTKNLNKLDFAFSGVFTSLRAIFSDELSVNVGVDYSRVLGFSDRSAWRSSPENYVDFTPSVSVDYSKKLSDKVGFSTSWITSVHWTDSASWRGTPSGRDNNRIDHSVVASLSWQAASKLVFQPNVRLQRVDYFEGKRADWFLSAGLGMIVPVTEAFSLRASFAVERRESNDLLFGTPDYDKMDASLSLSGLLRF